VFVAEPPDRIRVELEHRSLDATAPAGIPRDRVGADQGWPLYLDRFAKQLAA
jgi:hypothetical protein